jgi:hypothetical protein
VAHPITSVPRVRKRPNLILTVAFFDFRALSLMSQDETARFRQQAEECRQQAEKAVSPLDKESWLRMAGEWIKLAMTIEGRRP